MLLLTTTCTGLLFVLVHRPFVLSHLSPFVITPSTSSPTVTRPPTSPPVISPLHLPPRGHTRLPTLHHPLGPELASLANDLGRRFVCPRPSTREHALLASGIFLPIHFISPWETSDTYQNYMMAPHAMSDMSSSTLSYTSTAITSPDEIACPVRGDRRSNLQRFDTDEVQDLVCCGFGPASLAIAVALHDSLELNNTRLATRAPRVRFLEKQHKFAWHAGMLLPGAKMQITFLKDMATLRNPRSEFTFLNYLHAKDRLVAFTNLNTFLPQRVEYEDYMRWCAEHFNNVVDYSQNVESVTAGPKNPKTGAVEYFNVHSNNSETGARQTLKAKNVVIAAGGRPRIPDTLPQHHPRIIHSSQYATHVNKMFPEGSHPKRVAVIGGGQSAAECWHDIPTRFPGAQSVLLIRGAALKPSDDSPL